MAAYPVTSMIRYNGEREPHYLGEDNKTIVLDHLPQVKKLGFKGSPRKKKVAINIWKKASGRKGIIQNTLDPWASSPGQLIKPNVLSLEKWCFELYITVKRNW